MRGHPQAICIIEMLLVLRRDEVARPFRITPLRRKQKTDVAEHPEVSDHVGLLVNEPPTHWGCYLSSRPTTAHALYCVIARRQVEFPSTDQVFEIRLESQ